jgi:SAM-dependent methyltransferase
MAELLPDEQVTKSTYDALATQWAGEHSTQGFWLDEMRRYHEQLPGGKILEIGAGGARDAKELVKLGYDYVGTDVSTGLLEIARNELPGYPFFEQSVYDLDFDGEQFDGFWASAVLLHIPKSRIDEALSRIKSVVRARAIGFISIKDGTGERRELDEKWFTSCRL